MFVISFATPKYHEEIVHLLKGLREFNIPHEIHLLNEFKTWEDAVFNKPAFIREMLIKHRKPLVWIDADMEIRQYPKIFDELEERPSCTPDIAYPTFNDRFNGTVVFYNDTPEVFGILGRWEENNRQNPNAACGDQEGEEKAIKDTPEARVFVLPKEYGMFDLCKDQSCPVLWSRQASRKHRVQK